MIEIALTGRCEGCKHFDMTMDGYEEKVGCLHEEICDMWEQRLEEARRADEENDGECD